MTGIPTSLSAFNMFTLVLIACLYLLVHYYVPLITVEMMWQKLKVFHLLEKDDLSKCECNFT